MSRQATPATRLIGREKERTEGKWQDVFSVIITQKVTADL